MLDGENPYRLRNTGQGLHRMQTAPNISRAMHGILTRVKRKIGEAWVGLSVVHLGDHDVPNALIFIDKYNQVTRILEPIVDCIQGLDHIAADPDLNKAIVQRYGGVEQTKLMILRDFFCHGFDGSGSDGGSCVDGRLTSAWNWCSKIQKKNYYHIFMLTGFTGFDGNW